MTIPIFILEISDFGTYSGKYYYDSNDTAKPPNSKGVAYPRIGKWKMVGNHNKFLWIKWNDEVMQLPHPRCTKTSGGVVIQRDNGWTAATDKGYYVTLGGSNVRDSYPGEHNTTWNKNKLITTPAYADTFITKSMTSASVPEKGQYVCMIPK